MHLQGFPEAASVLPPNILLPNRQPKPCQSGEVERTVPQMMTVAGYQPGGHDPITRWPQRRTARRVRDVERHAACTHRQSLAL